MVLAGDFPPDESSYSSGSDTPQWQIGLGAGILLAVVYICSGNPNCQNTRDYSNIFSTPTQTIRPDAPPTARIIATPERGLVEMVEE